MAISWTKHTELDGGKNTRIYIVDLGRSGQPKKESRIELIEEKALCSLFGRVDISGDQLVIFILEER